MAILNDIKTFFIKDKTVELPPVNPPAPYPIVNYYEAQGQSQQRSDPYNPIRNADLDLTEYARNTIIRKSRYLVNNSPILSGIIEKMVVNIIGGGLVPQPDSSDNTFNQAAKRAFGYWSENCDVNGYYDFISAQELILRGMLVNGDAFCNNTFIRGADKIERPRIQILESHNINSLGSKYDQNEYTMYDGLLLDKKGKVVSYFSDGIELPVDSIVHFTMPIRANLHRGIPLFTPVINTALDLDDILALEKIAVKEVASHTDIISTVTGEPNNMDMIKRARYSATGAQTITNAVVTTPTTEGDLYYRNQFGPSAKYIKLNDKWEAYKSERPSPAWQGFVDYLSNTLCISVGLTPSILLGNKIGGADTRRDIAQAKKVFERYQRVLSYKLSSIYKYVIQSDIDNGFLRNPPKDWYRVKWVYPRSITADYARESQEDRADVASGLMSISEYAGNYGDTEDSLLDNMAKEEIKIADKEKQYNLPPETLRKRLFQFPLESVPSGNNPSATPTNSAD